VGVRRAEVLRVCCAKRLERRASTEASFATTTFVSPNAAVRFRPHIWGRGRRVLEESSGWRACHDERYQRDSGEEVGGWPDPRHPRMYDRGRLRRVPGVPVMRSEVPARAIVEAPSHLGLHAAGVEALPEALLAAGLADRLGARRGTRLAAPAFDPSIDADTGLLNPHGLVDHASRLADAVGAALDEGTFPIVLGGDCSILLGITLALRRRGRYGLLFLDGHADFYQPEAEPAGEAASMELALVTGRGPDLVTDLEGRRPLLRDEDVVVFGFRDADHAAAEGSQPLAPPRPVPAPPRRRRGRLPAPAGRGYPAAQRGPDLRRGDDLPDRLRPGRGPGRSHHRVQSRPRRRGRLDHRRARPRAGRRALAG
jgi:Arginase family